MTDGLRLWLFVVGPLTVVGITVIAWAILIAVQTPRAFRRDRFNVSLFGTIVPLGIYLISRAVARAGYPPAFDVQLVVMISSTFALIGWPSIIRRFRAVIDEKSPRSN